MISSLLLASLLGAPRAPQNSEFVVFVPKLEATKQLLPFFTRAGSRSALFRPQGWSTDVHPLIDVDFSNSEALARAGIDAAAAVTQSHLGEASVACVGVSQVDAYRKAADEKLARLGQVFEKVEAGVSVYASRDPVGRVLGAYALRGKNSCAIGGHGRSVETLLPVLAKTLTTNPTGSGFAIASKLPGVMQWLVPTGKPLGAVALSGKDLALTVDGKTQDAPLAQLAGSGQSPFGALAAPGMAVIKARLSKAQLPELAAWLGRRLPFGESVRPLAEAASAFATGNVALVVSHVKVSSGLRTNLARFFALRSALLVEVGNPTAVAALLEKFDQRSLAVREGTLTISLQGSTLVLANDPEARTLALRALPQGAGKQAHGLEFTIDPKLVARGLQQVPLLEAIQAPELAGLVAAGSELGPLLLASEHISGWLDSSAASQHQGQLVWRLEEDTFAGDAGTP